jgi:hypothetical protein
LDTLFIGYDPDNKEEKDKQRKKYTSEFKIRAVLCIRNYMPATLNPEFNPCSLD